MPYTIRQFQSTPNPNALKCWLEHAISETPRSFRSKSDADADPIARRLFDEAGVTNVFFCGDWLTINKPPEATWPAVRKKVAAVLASIETDDDR